MGSAIVSGGKSTRGPPFYSSMSGQFQAFQWALISNRHTRAVLGSSLSWTASRLDRKLQIERTEPPMTRKASAPRILRWVFEYREAKLAPSYFSELDGLRGVAVILVVLYHLDLPGFEGGWLGVDAFFVISGFLITGIIVSEIGSGHFHYGRFLLKRAQRLLPALALMTVVTSLIAWSTFSAAQLSRFGDSVVGVAGYFSNFTFMLDDSYFEQSVATTPLLHTWSLAVEEQFYIIFPLVLVTTFAFKKDWIRPVLILLTALSLGAWLYIRQFEVSPTLSDWSFYLLPTRAWEFGVGALVALVFGATGPPGFSAHQAKLGAGAGGALLVGALVMGGRWPDQGIPSVLMAVALMLLISFSRGTGIGRLLSSRLLAGVGALSYGIYLWHFPLIAFAKILSADEKLSAGSAVLVVLATLAAALVSLKFVENPIRLSTLRWSWAISMVMIFIVSLASLGLFTRSVNDSNVTEIQAAGVLAEKPWVYFSDLDERIFQVSRLAIGVPPSVTTVVVGSSRMMQVSSEVAGEPVLNLSVSGASLEDLHALGMGGLRVTGAKRILIGVDPWTLHPDSGQSRWTSIRAEYEFWAGILDEGKDFAAVNISDLPSQQIDEPLASRLYRLVAMPMPVPENADPELIAKKAQDGSHIYDVGRVALTESEKVDGFPGIASYSNMEEFVAGEREISGLQSLTQYLHNNDVEVVLVLPPYHPGVFSELSGTYPEYAEAESKLREIAADTGVALLGSFDPKKVSCSGSEFYDGFHPKESCMKTLLKSG